MGELDDDERTGVAVRVTADVWLLTALAFHVLVAFGVAFYAVVVRRESWLSPIMQFLVFLELFTLPLPVRAMQTLEIEGDVTEHLPQIYRYLAPSVALVTIGLLAFVTAYYLPVCKRYAAALPLICLRHDRPIYPSVVAVCGVSVVLIALLASSTGGILAFVLLGYGASAEMFGKGYLAAGFPWLFVGACLLLVRYAAYRRRRDLALFGMAWFVVAAMNIVMGNRSAILYQGLVVVIFWNLAVARVRFARALPLVAVAFLALNLFGYLRGARYESLGDVVASGGSKFGRVQESGDLHHGLFYTITTGEFVVPFETLPTVMAARDDQVTPKWGSTLANSLSLVVPSVFWPDRPLPLASWYVREFYGAGYGSNEGRQFYFATEGWVNFGPGGVLLIMGLWGLAWGIVGRYLLREKLDPAGALVGALCVAYIPRAIAGDSATLLVAIPEQSLLPLVAIYPFITRWVRRPAGLVGRSVSTLDSASLSG